MKKSFSVFITIIGLCFLLTGISFADGGGVKMVQEGPDDIGLNQYCEDMLPDPKKVKKGDEIEGSFIAHQEKGMFVSEITLEGGQKTAFGYSPTKKVYMIYIPSLDPNLHICGYSNEGLLARFKDFACKKKVDLDFGYQPGSVYPVVDKIHITSKPNCGTSFDDKDNLPTILGEVVIIMSPLKLSLNVFIDINTVLIWTAPLKFYFH